MKTLKISNRVQRMERFRKLNGKSAINLVSLMDIFSILVFFLLISSSSVQQLPSNKDLTLPTTHAEKVPRETLVVTITRDRILVQGVEVAKIDDILLAVSPLIEGLEKELKFHASKSSSVLKDEAVGLPVTIMGDENIPYQLLRKVLLTCRQANYTSIAFSALQTVDE
ncbi:MAG TPA: biopolymer transporter ExbD [Gammaproteobacteria bacterium]|nr:biopolymer transporter ExbD [Gammaproteobacteria bacterium]